MSCHHHLAGDVVAICQQAAGNQPSISVKIERLAHKLATAYAVQQRPKVVRCGTTMNATVSLSPSGWHISFACEIEHDAPANHLPAVGMSFHCRQCGFRAHADHNAAINILRRNTASMIVEEGHRLSVEAITAQGVNPLGNLRPSGRGRC